MLVGLGISRSPRIGPLAAAEEDLQIAPSNVDTLGIIQYIISFTKTSFTLQQKEWN